MYDVFFISYYEPHADANWKALKSIVPYARRINGVKGIQEAHAKAAKTAMGSHFFVVDCDNEITDPSVFRTKLETWDEGYVHLWYAENRVNDLVYGWGGVKLFPKALFVGQKMGLDMTTSFPLKIIETPASITHFNCSAEESWRSAFREAVKLSQKDDEVSAQRLDAWKTKAVGPYASYVLLGASQGSDFGIEHRNDPDHLNLINDYDWLRDRFMSVEQTLR